MSAEIYNTHQDTNIASNHGHRKVYIDIFVKSTTPIVEKCTVNKKTYFI